MGHGPVGLGLGCHPRAAAGVVITTGKAVVRTVTRTAVAPFLAGQHEPLRRQEMRIGHRQAGGDQAIDCRRGGMQIGQPLESTT